MIKDGEKVTGIQFCNLQANRDLKSQTSEREPRPRKVVSPDGPRVSKPVKTIVLNRNDTRLVSFFGG
jgi:hypothetical protein